MPPLDPATTRRLIMQAASELLVEVGYQRMTTAAIAKRAGVAEGTLYRHFRTKEELVEAVFSDIWRIVNEFMEAELPSREQPLERLQSFFATALRSLQLLQPQYKALGQQECLYYAARHGCVCELPPGPKEYVALLAESIRLAQAVGAVRPEVNAEIAALFFFTGVGSVLDLLADPHGLGKECPEDLSKVTQALEGLMNFGLFGAEQ